MRPDSQLIWKIKRQQSREAADLLISRYYQDIFAYAYRQVGDRELAMDLTQEIFILILQGIGSFDEKKASFRTWAYRIASNKITDYYRSFAHRQKSMELPLDAEEQNEMLVKDVSELIVQRDAIRRVMAAAAGFGTEWLRIFQKKCFEEKTFAEIAEEMGLSVGTVKTRFYCMLRKIKQEVSEDG